MAVYFALINRETGERADLARVDDELRLAFGEEPDDKQWLYRWYDRIGMPFAVGKTLEEVREYCQEGAEEFVSWRPLPKVVDWLEAHYTIECGWCR